MQISNFQNQRRDASNIYLHHPYLKSVWVPDYFEHCYILYCYMRMLRDLKIEENWQNFASFHLLAFFNSYALWHQVHLVKGFRESCRPELKITKLSLTLKNLKLDDLDKVMVLIWIIVHWSSHFIPLFIWQMQWLHRGRSEESTLRTKRFHQKNDGVKNEIRVQSKGFRSQDRHSRNRLRHMHRSTW